MYGPYLNFCQKIGLVDSEEAIWVREQTQMTIFQDQASKMTTLKTDYFENYCNIYNVIKSTGLEIESF